VRDLVLGLRLKHRRIGELGLAFGHDLDGMVPASDGEEEHLGFRHEVMVVPWDILGFGTGHGHWVSIQDLHNCSAGIHLYLHASALGVHHWEYRTGSPRFQTD
jgi:hypothetical protein